LISGTLLSLTLLIGGLVGVVYAAGVFLSGAVGVANRFGIPEFIVGSLIVAVGTSAPELAINLAASFQSQGDLIISNIVGSNIVNLGLGIGLAGLLIKFDKLPNDYLVSALIGFAAVGAVLVVTLLTANANGISTIGRAFSFILFGGFVAYTIWSLKYSSADDEEEYEISGRGMPFLAAQLFFGAVAMAVLADVTVDNAVILAGTLGIPTAVVGATVIAAGGSLPEVFACIAAARMGRPKIVVGNIVGSQIFNLLGILGVSGLVGAFTFNSTISVDIAILLAITVVFLLSFQVAAIRRHLGVLMVGSYLGYAAYLISISV
jgi:cation:H+ antiporter